MDDGIVELLVIPRMARYQRQYQFHSVKNWCDAYVFIQESTPLKNVTTGEFETMFKQFLRIKELIKELKANEEKKKEIKSNFYSKSKSYSSFHIRLGIFSKFPYLFALIRCPSA